MPYQSSSAASDVRLARFGLRIIRAMQPSAARCKTAECVASRSSRVWPADGCFHDCDNATRPALTAALVYPPAGRVSPRPPLTHSGRLRARASTTSLAGRWCFALRSSTVSASAPAPSCTDCRIIAGMQRSRARGETSGPRSEAKRPALASGRNPVVRIAHIRASMLAEDGVVERDFRKHCEEKPGNASA